MIVSMMQVALGGAIGSALRFGIGATLTRPGQAFPVGVLTVNVLGSLLMGSFATWFASRGGASWQPFVLTGLLGGFTTFSAFSLEAWTLWERGQGGLAASYVGASVTLSLAALALGVWLARAVAA
ncbi:fluoride efflux transporter CrcB [Jannaschia sp. LMIT008]|uniref:fluoride efflux transporter CrcB n=1 Tax=Jannaschia maritima TaxID=3032585 RepID=UPI002811BAD2|nr:fluoride efflux transporter CrcB [Jannaschia sp. LMIT008]